MIGLVTMTGREGVIGQVPDALVFAGMEINVVQAAAVPPDIMCIEGPLRATAARCDLGRMARCQDPLRQVVMVLLMLVMPLVMMRRLALGRSDVGSSAVTRGTARKRRGVTTLSGLATASDADPRRMGPHPALTGAPVAALNLAPLLQWVREEPANPREELALLTTTLLVMDAASLLTSGSSSWNRRPRVLMAPSGGDCGGSRRRQLPADRLAPLPRPTATVAAGCGFGTPAAGRRIRCTTGLAAAHRDPTLPRGSVVLMRIAMGTGYQANAELRAGFMPAGRHSAARRSSSAREAGGGLPSSAARATPSEVARR